MSKGSSWGSVLRVLRARNRIRGGALTRRSRTPFGFCTDATRRKRVACGGNGGRQARRLQGQYGRVGAESHDLRPRLRQPGGFVDSHTAPSWNYEGVLWMGIFKSLLSICESGAYSLHPPEVPRITVRIRTTQLGPSSPNCILFQMWFFVKKLWTCYFCIFESGAHSPQCLPEGLKPLYRVQRTSAPNRSHCTVPVEGFHAYAFGLSLFRIGGIAKHNYFTRLTFSKISSRPHSNSVQR